MDPLTHENPALEAAQALPSRGDHQAAPRRERRAQALLDLPDLLDHVGVGHAHEAGLSDAREGGHEALAPDEGLRQERPDLLRRRAEVGGAAERADRLAGAAVVELRLAEAPEDVGGGGAV